MTNEEFLREINSLPPEAQRQIEDFISFLRERYKSSQSKIVPPSEIASAAPISLTACYPDFKQHMGEH